MMHWITAVYLVSAVVVYAAEIYQTYRRGLIFLDDLLKPLPGALCPVINTGLALFYAWIFIIEMSEGVFIWKRRN